MTLQEFFDDLCDRLELFVVERGAIVPFATLFDATGELEHIYYDPGGPLEAGWRDFVLERCLDAASRRGWRFAALVWMPNETAISALIASSDDCFLASFVISQQCGGFRLSDPEFHRAPNFLTSKVF